jgi:hypothetical protein
MFAMERSLRSGLVEIPGTQLPTYASVGVEARARAVGRIAESACDYLATLLGVRPEVQVLVISEADWPSRGRAELFGLPNAGEGTLVVAGEDAAWWSDLASMAGAAGAREVAAVYRSNSGDLDLGPFFDLVTVHEVAHLFAEPAVRFPRHWLSELFANLCLHAWVERRAPASLPTLLTLPRLAAGAAADGFEFRTRKAFEESYDAIPGPNYVWYQFRLQVEAAALFQAGGEDSVRRLFDRFRVGPADPDGDATEPPALDDPALAERLAAVDPQLGEFSLAF